MATAAADSSASNTSRGAFIVFEGIDRSGKSTQATRLVDAMRAAGGDVEHWRFPDNSTAVGKMLRAYLEQRAELDDRATHLVRVFEHYACRAELCMLVASRLFANNQLLLFILLGFLRTC